MRHDDVTTHVGDKVVNIRAYTVYVRCDLSEATGRTKIKLVRLIATPR